MERRGFLKVVLAGMAAAPVAGAAAGVTQESIVETDDVQVRRWKHGGVSFAEWTLPSSVPPHFEEKGDETVHQAMSVGDVAGAGRPIRVKRRYVVPVFNKAETKASMSELVERVLEAQSTMPMRNGLVKDGASGERISKGAMSNFLIVKVHGRRALLGLGAFPVEVVPVADFYAGVDEKKSQKDSPGWESLAHE